jgi:predicted transcriptional regulator
MQITEAEPGETWTAADQSAWDGTIALVSALLSNTSSQLSSEDLQSRVQDTFATLLGLRHPTADPKPESPTFPAPTWNEIENSIGTDAMISFEDGRPYKNLKRHLHTHGLTPDQYREKWRLPADYPMTHPSYRALRSQMAKAQGLGGKRRAAGGENAVDTELPSGPVPARSSNEDCPHGGGEAVTIDALEVAQPVRFSGSDTHDVIVGDQL